MVNTLELIKSLKGLDSQKTVKGFTLIELLIVVIIMGILAAIALPNLLSQVAKGRQAEAKNNLGALNRAQQAYRLEELTFTNNVDNLPVKLSWQYYRIGFVNYTLSNVFQGYYAKALSNYENDILDYGAGVYQDETGKFVAIICEEKFLNAHNNFVPSFVTLDRKARRKPLALDMGISR